MLQTVVGWATAISAGPADESSQSLSFNVTNGNAALFSVAPAVSAAGDLTYTPAPDANGTATVTVTVTDNGGGGDTSASQSVHDHGEAGERQCRPSRRHGQDGARGRRGAVRGRVGNRDLCRAGQRSRASRFRSTSPTTTTPFSRASRRSRSNGTLTFTPAANANGTATVTVAVHDNGGTADGGVDTSATQTFAITVTAVNDAPSFAKGGDQTVLEDPGAQIVENWATGISAGPADEGGSDADLHRHERQQRAVRSPTCGQPRRADLPTRLRRTRTGRRR